MAASGVVKVLVGFYRSREDSAFERHRSRVTFDPYKVIQRVSLQEKNI